MSKIIKKNNYKKQVLLHRHIQIKSHTFGVKVVQDHAVRCRGRVLECNCEFPVVDRRAQWHLLAVDRRKKSECITREGKHLPHLQHHL